MSDLIRWLANANDAKAPPATRKMFAEMANAELSRRCHPSMPVDPAVAQRMTTSTPAKR